MWTCPELMIQITAGTQRALKLAGTISRAAGKAAVTCGSNVLEACQHSCVQNLHANSRITKFLRCSVLSDVCGRVGIRCANAFSASIKTAPSLENAFISHRNAVACCITGHLFQHCWLLSNYQAAKPDLLTQILLKRQFLN